MEFEVLFEDNHLLIVNKPAGLLVQGDRTGDECLVDSAKDYIKDKYEKPGAVFLGLVHRLDRPVSGVVALARTSKALTRMNKLFQERKVQKTYWAMVNKYPEQEQATLTHWLVKDPSKNKTKAFTKPKQGAAKAILNYQVLGKSSQGTLLEVLPTTGRPHQIRVQLAQIGSPIAGDLRYGTGPANDDSSICLHARSLTFEHPVRKEEMTIAARLPKLPMWNSFRKYA